eukprot:610782_1
MAPTESPSLFAYARSSTYARSGASPVPSLVRMTGAEWSSDIGTAAGLMWPVSAVPSAEMFQFCFSLGGDEVLKLGLLRWIRGHQREHFDETALRLRENVQH